MEVTAHLLILTCLVASFVTKGLALKCHTCTTPETCKKITTPIDCRIGLNACYMTITNNSLVLARGCRNYCHGGGGENGITNACCTEDGCNEKAPSLKCYACANIYELCKTPIETYCDYNDPFCYKVVQKAVIGVHITQGCLSTCREVSSEFYTSYCCKGNLCNGGDTAAPRLLFTGLILALLAAMTNLVRN
ncbi:uncharacterized protein LOC144737996 [Lampetra planeri]